MNRNDARSSRTQRLTVETEEEFRNDIPVETSRRRRTQAARIRMEEDGFADTVVPPSRETLTVQQHRYARQAPQEKPKAQLGEAFADDLPPERLEIPYRRRYDDVPDEEFDDEESYYDDETESPRQGKRHVVRWVIILTLLLALLAGATYIGLQRPDLVAPVVQWGREMIYGPTPSPSPSPSPTPEPSPTPTPMPSVGEAIVIGFIAEPIIQPDINQPVIFEVTTTKQTDRVQIVDNNGQVLMEAMEGSYNETDYGRVWNMMVYFLSPYDGAVEVYPGNVSGWNEANSSSMTIKVGAVQPEPEAQGADAQGTPDAAGTDLPGEGVPAVAGEGVPVSTASVQSSVFVKNEPVDFFARENPIRFGDAEGYMVRNGVPNKGVTTFRGSGMRQNSAYGVAAPVEKRLQSVWSAQAGSAGDGTYTWNTQALIQQWHTNIRSLLPLSDASLKSVALKEVVFAANDGKVYFFNLTDGTPTRDPFAVNPSAPMLGAASLYPTGLPMLFVGEGDPNVAGSEDGGFLVYSLTNPDKPGRLKGVNDNASSANSAVITSPLIADTGDAMVGIGGNGLLYTLTLNTKFDAETGKVEFPAATVEMYKTVEGSADTSVYSSLAAYGEYAYFADEAGILQRVNLNTLENVWSVNLNAGVDGAVALDIESTGEDPVLYVATTADAEGYAHMRRFNTGSGDIDWDTAVKGSISASPLVGQNNLGRMVLFTATNEAGGATLYALSKDTGEIVWQYALQNATDASPIALYDAEGISMVVQGDGADLHLLDGQTGELLDSLALDAAIIGSPAAFDNMIVVATLDGKLNGVGIQ